MPQLGDRQRAEVEPIGEPKLRPGVQMGQVQAEMTEPANLERPRIQDAPDAIPAVDDLHGTPPFGRSQLIGSCLQPVFSSTRFPAGSSQKICGSPALPRTYSTPSASRCLAMSSTLPLMVNAT